MAIKTHDFLNSKSFGNARIPKNTPSHVQFKIFRNFIDTINFLSVFY